MFSLFEQLPYELQREILLVYPESLPQIIRTNKTIRQLVMSDIFKHYDTQPSEKEIVKYVNSDPKMLLKCDQSSGFKLFVLDYDNHLCTEERFYSDSINTLLHVKEISIVKFLNGIVTAAVDIGRFNPVNMNSINCADLKKDYTIYTQRTGFMNFNPHYAKLKVTQQLNELYSQADKPIYLLSLMYYLNHTRAIFNNASVDITYTSRFYDYDQLSPDDSKLQKVKDEIEKLYSELLNAITNLTNV